MARRAGPRACTLHRRGRLEVPAHLGMGIASYDLEGDGYPDYFLTSMADNKLQTLAEVTDGAAPKPSP